MKKLVFVIICGFWTFFNLSAYAIAQTVVLQGDPIMLTIDSAKSLAEVSSAVFNNKKVNVFLYQNKPTVLFGIDLNQKPGDYVFSAELVDGSKFEKTITVSEREKPKQELGIPEKLGGNTKQSQTALVSSLGSENAVLASLWTGKKAF